MSKFVLKKQQFLLPPYLFVKCYLVERLSDFLQEVNSLNNQKKFQAAFICDKASKFYVINNMTFLTPKLIKSVFIKENKYMCVII